MLCFVLINSIILNLLCVRMLKDHSGPVPTAALLVCAARPHKDLLWDEGVSVSPAVVSRTESASDRKTAFWHSFAGCPARTARENSTKQLRPIRDDDDDVGLRVLGCRVDILADQRGERHFKKRWIQAACGAQWSTNNRQENLHYYILFIVQKILFVFCRRESLTFRIYKTIVYGPRKHSGVSLIS